VATTELTMDAQALGAVPPGPMPPPAGAPAAPGAFAATPDVRHAVAIVEADPRLRMLLAARLPGAQQFETIDELTQVLQMGRPTVVVFGPSLVTPFGFEHVHRLTSVYPELGAIFAAHALSTEILQHALRVGARDAVQVDERGDTLLQAVARVGELIQTPTRPTPMAPSTPGAPSGLMPRNAPGRLIVVFSTKGGVGKSTVATNVAAAMARAVDDTVSLMDADLQFGDVSVMLGIPPDHTVVEAAAAIHYADPELMRNLVTRHETGLMVLPAPSEPNMAAVVSPDEMTAVCSGLQAISGYVVVDTPTSFDDTTLGLLESADEVLLVGSMDIPSVKNLKIGLQAFDLVAIAGPKLRLVLNRANAQVKLDVREVEHVLGLKAAFPIPYDLAVPLSINAGLPVVTHDPRSAAARAFEHIAQSLLGPAIDTGKGRRKGTRKKSAKQ
jgi:pilus assembly protein CpaE